MSARRSRILLLIESPDLAGILQIALREHDLDFHARMDRARDAVRRGGHDLAVIDLGLSSLPAGLALIKDWRSLGIAFPIIAISDLPRPALAVDALNAGADDFLRKPFHHAELLVRMQKQLARKSPVQAIRRAGGVVLGREPFLFAGATVTPDLLIRFADGSEEKLRPKHHGILRVFAERAGQLVLKDELVREVWGSDGNRAGHSVNEYVSTLRQLFQRHRVDFNRVVVNEPKAGWRVDAKAGRAAGPPAA